MSASGREQQINAFIAACGWEGARLSPLAMDASTRRYWRLHRNGQTAVLMDAPPDPQSRPCPPDASAEQRAALGYNALARLAGSDVRAFAALATELVARGFAAPAVLGFDPDAGLMLLEDLGDALFSIIADDGTVAQPLLYSAAIDTLAALSRCSFDAHMPLGSADWLVRDYDHTALLSEAELLPLWYAPWRSEAIAEGALQNLQALWCQAFEVLDDLPKVLVLRDVHAENLLWQAQNEGIARTGLLDFQDALFGSPAYDLVCLLQDSRRELPDGLEAAMKSRFVELARIRDEEAFDAAYAVLGAQRSAKVLGIFVRLAKRDGKPRYLVYLPIAARNFVRSLAHPALSHVRQWMRQHIPAVFTEAET